jgi:hypothetical protein
MGRGIINPEPFSHPLIKANHMIHPRAESLASRLEKGRQKTLEFLNKLTPEQWQEPLYQEPMWHVHNLLSHFVSAENELFTLIQSVAEGKSGAPFNLDIDEYNAAEQSRLEGISPEILLGKFDQARRKTIAWVQTLGPDQLDRIGWHPVLGNVNVETMLLSIYGHQLMHMRDLMKLMGSVV